MKHTKQQIQEAISYWKDKLEKLNESAENDQVKAFQEIIKAAKDLGVDTSVVQIDSTNETEELDEGATHGIMLGVMSAMLGICAIGKIANNIGDAFDTAPKEATELFKSVDTSLSGIKQGLEKINAALQKYKEDAGEDFDAVISKNAASKMNQEFQ